MRPHSALITSTLNVVGDLQLMEISVQSMMLTLQSTTSNEVDLKHLLPGSCWVEVITLMVLTRMNGIGLKDKQEEKAADIYHEISY